MSNPTSGTVMSMGLEQAGGDEAISQSGVTTTTPWRRVFLDRSRQRP